MRWWCSASDANWTWAWRPYVGSWLVVALVAFGYWRGGAFDRTRHRRRKAAAVVGLVLLLAANDWPLASLGAGYLVSAQMVRQVLIVMIAAPLLLYGSPPALGNWIEATARRRRVFGLVSTPVFAIVVSTALIVSVSVPVFTDPMLRTQFGSFVLDFMWITAGILIWLPVQPPRPMVPRLSGVLVIVYLIVVSVAPLPVAFFMTWSDFPIYHTYQLAPRVIGALDANEDQELAAAIFQVAGGLVIWLHITARWVHMSGATRAPRFRGPLVAAQESPR
ncbi:MAG: cytochrome c oxidase assembly protein [Microthrixaceae bacterium]